MKHIFRSKTFHILLGLGVSGAVILWLYFKIEWRQVGHYLTQTDYWVVFPIYVVWVAHFFIRAVRWRYLLAGGEKASLATLFNAIMLGNFATFILPLRAGEFIRPFFLSRKSNISFSIGFASVVIERFFDLAIVLLSFGIMLFFVQDVPPLVHRGAVFLTLLGAASFLFMVVGSYWVEPVMNLVDNFLRYAPSDLRPPLRRFVSDLLEGAALLQRGGKLLWVVALSLIVWASCYFAFYLYLFMFEASLHPAMRSIWLGIATSVVVALAVAAPSAPGFVAVYQVGCVAGFALFGVSEELAVTYSVVSHIAQYLFIVGYGAGYLVLHNMSLRELRGDAGGRLEVSSPSSLALPSPNSRKSSS